MYDPIKRALIFLATISMLTAAVPAGAQVVAYDKSRITCISRQMNVPVEARFKQFTAQIAFDPAKPAAGTARIEIDTGSFDIDNAEVNDEARGKAWFDAKTFPKATFVSTGIKPLGGGRYEVRGPLTIKGRTQEAAVPMTYNEEAGGAAFDGAFTIKRLQYNIGEGVWKDTDTVADEVQIKFHIVVAAGKTAVKK
ncbi:MAG: putative signal peptide protein [Betaproteobacteria bacterium]|nr:putative signal peptide protein [Betaproteobacteria bacterium]